LCSAQGAVQCDASAVVKVSEIVVKVSEIDNETEHFTQSLLFDCA
jgi:hypothetical protein